MVYYGRMQENYHHPEARQMAGRNFGLDAVIDRLSVLSPIEWLNQLRVEKAAVLLADRTLSVQQVCRAVGFQSQAFFAKMFRRYKGLSPSRYRAQAGFHNSLVRPPKLALRV